MGAARNRRRSCGEEAEERSEPYFGDKSRYDTIRYDLIVDLGIQ